MNVGKLQEVALRLESLDERLTHRVRPRQAANMGRLTGDLLESRVRDVSDYTVELKEIVRDLVTALAPSRTR